MQRNIKLKPVVVLIESLFGLAHSQKRRQSYRQRMFLCLVTVNPVKCRASTPKT